MIGGLRPVTVYLCEACADGNIQDCRTPGCAYWVARYQGGAMSNMQERLQLRDIFRARLSELGYERRARQAVIIGPDGEPYLEWQLYEISQMTDLINELRARHGSGPVETGLTERADRMAAGHCDYAEKFPLYCAELVLDDSPQRA